MMAFLPLDILPIILSHLTIPDIYRVRLVCREYRLLTKTRSLWFAYIQRYFLRHNISVPGLHGRPLGTLDAQELETLTLKAERYRKNWLSGAQSPKPTRHVEFIAVPDSRIIALKFLSRNGENWLFSLAMTRNHGMRAFTFQCWDLKFNPPICIARRILHHFAGMAFNKLETGRAVVAVKTPECVGFFPSCCLGALTCPGVLLRICLIDIDTGGAAGGESSGKRASVGDSNSTRHPAQACVNVANLDDRAVGTLMLLGDLVLAQDNAGRSFLYHFESPQIRVQLIDPEGNAQPEIILDVLVDRGWLILARTKTVELYQLPASIDHNAQIEPIARHTWQWKVDSIVLAPLVNNAKNSITPIQIVLRYGSVHPWPVNMMHRFMLRPNTDFDSSLPARRSNNPYVFPLVSTQSIGSPIRLLATYDMAVGSYGTIVYFDSHTEDYFGHSDFGQRLAGMRIPEEGEAGEVVPDSSVYRVIERDEWTRVALQEEEGKIAVGHVDGKITLLDYA